MRPEPKFVPGEVVSIRDGHSSGLGGCQTVIISAEWGETTRAFTGDPLSPGWRYETELRDPRSNHANRFRWPEGALRKLPGNLLGDMSSIASIWTPKLDEAKA